MYSIIYINKEYPCCVGSKVIETDKQGDWGYEDNHWCGIVKKESDKSNNDCWSLPGIFTMNIYIYIYLILIFNSIL